MRAFENVTLYQWCRVGQSRNQEKINQQSVLQIGTKGDSKLSNQFNSINETIRKTMAKLERCLRE